MSFPADNTFWNVPATDFANGSGPPTLLDAAQDTDTLSTSPRIGSFDPTMENVAGNSVVEGYPAAPQSYPYPGNKVGFHDVPMAQAMPNDGMDIDDTGAWNVNRNSYPPPASYSSNFGPLQPSDTNGFANASGPTRTGFDNLPLPPNSSASVQARAKDMQLPHWMRPAATGHAFHTSIPHAHPILPDDLYPSDQEVDSANELLPEPEAPHMKRGRGRQPKATGVAVYDAVAEVIARSPWHHPHGKQSHVWEEILQFAREKHPKAYMGTSVGSFKSRITDLITAHMDASAVRNNAIGRELDEPAAISLASLLERAWDLRKEATELSSDERQKKLQARTRKESDGQAVRDAAHTTGPSKQKKGADDSDESDDDEATPRQHVAPDTVKELKGIRRDMANFNAEQTTMAREMLEAQQEGNSIQAKYVRALEHLVGLGQLGGVGAGDINVGGPSGGA
ncbi:hypothetical protein CYLTODRAFT_460258 [Cylindrobasidium torrendii FP15055 ss-10]|uniref:Uncharacterized protein n=1 Tax=Cylindrobasidium torrendii FP15055 ss-10 TaxID=1314674 RepID=A0A0D7AT08_9AGAR|nr:hypothetical protein CYLTODRAFT_460258 [Cylindrobasidium torrendii FP15055 ss-10]